MGLLTRRQGMGVAALALGLSVFLSRILGLVRDKVISYYFGTGSEADVYFAAFVVPDFLNYLLAGGYFSITLVPLLAMAFARSEEDGWRFFSGAVSWAALLITILTVVAWIFVPQLVRFVAPGFSPENLERLSAFMRIILPAQMCFLPGACFSAMLYYRRQFTVPALTPLVYNGGIIAGGVLWLYVFPERGMEGFCWGVLAGALCGSLLLPMMAVRAGGMDLFPPRPAPVGEGHATPPGREAAKGADIAVSTSDAARGADIVVSNPDAAGGADMALANPEPAGNTGMVPSKTEVAGSGAASRASARSAWFDHPDMKKVLFLALPLMLGQSVVALDEQFVRIFGSLTGEGGVSLLNYARRIMLVPVGVVAQAAGLATYPFLAALAAEKNYGAFNQSLNRAVSNTVLVALPLSLWMMAAGEPIMRLIFQQGQFTAEAATQSGLLLTIMLASVAFWAVQQLVGRAFYAHQDTLTPALCGTAATVLALPLYWYGAKNYGAPGVAVAGSLGVALYTLALCAVWTRRFGRDALAGLSRKLLLSLLFCIPAYAAAYGANIFMLTVFAETSLWGAFLRICATGTVFAALYLILARLFAPQLCEPLTSLAGKVRRKLGGK